MTDSRLDTVLQSAVGHIRTAVGNTLDQITAQLGPLSQAATNNLQRQSLTAAHRELLLKAPRIKQTFEREMLALASSSVQNTPQGSANSLSNTDWASLSLVDNAEVERGVTADRLAQAVVRDCDKQLEALSTYIAALLDDASPERNPFRPKQVTKALLDSLIQGGLAEDAIDATTSILARLLGPQLATSYDQIVASLRSLGVQPQGFTVSKSRESALGRTTSASQQGDLAQTTTQAGAFTDTQAGRSEAHQRAANALGEMFGVAAPSLPTDAGHTGSALSTDFQNLLKQINQQAGPTGHDAVSAAGLQPAPSANPNSALAPGFAGPLMAANLIRANRDELVRASGGTALDQMVIDIVAALFDQVLSDPKVAPEMARQIARLQMPVLRVALGDMSFFNSRKHPVRRFVNRIASLSASFEDYSQGAGKDCLARVTTLVNDIVEGDFDQMAIYEAKLRELEAFIEAESARDAADSAAIASMLSGKEADLRVQQRYMQILRRELLDVDVPEFLRDFLALVWSQVQVMAATRDGADSALALRMKKTGRELALSVQPKGSPMLRKEFLLKLPQLMKDLNDGLALIQYPEAAKQAFFAQLLPAHADCLKAAPAHDLSTRLLEQRLKQVEHIAIPSREESANDPVPVALDNLQEPALLTSTAAFTAEEIRQAGFIPEAALSSGGALDINLDLAADPAEADPTLSDIDINLDIPAPPSAGLQLVHHIQKGTPYHMVMQGQWRKVRLTWISEGRSFFIFNHGQLHKQTISLTGRTLAKMCEAGRFRAFEQAELIERATVRARRQLAALGGVSA